jgi:hypothetical protein
MSKRQHIEKSTNDEAENSKRPSRAPEMLSTVGRYVERFNESRKALNKKGDKFNIDTFQKEEADHRELHGFSKLKQVGQTHDGLNRTSTAAVSQSGESGVSIAQVLSPADYFFFVDPESPFDSGFSVHSKAAQQVALNRGFQEIYYSHLSAIEQIPHRSPKASAIKKSDLPAPINLSMPQGTLPNLFRLEDEPYAVSLVRAFEHKFVDPDRKIPYSPIRLWTSEDRKLAGYKSTGPTATLSSWSAAYFAVRVVKKNEDPSDIKDSLSSLRKQATKNKPDQMPKGGWVDLALTVANNYILEN